ncbi:MAG: HDOD domain-containing protein [Gammaproteobacteria bacterium]|nr:HDOD domain-containing protein [Gammaproteobacteria bacterium]
MSLPDACLRVNQLIEDPAKSAADIAEVIIQDADLSARMLRLVNSAFYGLPGRVDTISRAVTIVGTQELRDLALMTATCDLFQGIPADMFIMRDFWHYSVACGVLARNLAKKCGVLHGERLFVMGVLHDIGRLAILQYQTEQARDVLLIADGKNELLTGAEQEVLGFDHAEVGYELAKSWNLPDSIATSMQCHHQPMAATEFRLESALVHIGQALAYGMVWGEQKDLPPDIDPGVWELTGLTVEDCAASLEAVGDEVMELFSILLGGSGQQKCPG